VAAEAIRTGVLPNGFRRRNAIPHEDEAIRVGDPDDDSLSNEYVGEDLPGGSTPTPDQSNVDEIGRVYGVQDEDSGALRTSSVVPAATRSTAAASPTRPPRLAQAKGRRASGSLRVAPGSRRRQSTSARRDCKACTSSGA